MATMMYPTTTLTKSQSMRAKRKSAVELLAESKPFYVKSEIVRDNTQALPSRPVSSNFTVGYNSGASYGNHYGTYTRSKSVTVTGQNCYNFRPTILPQQYIAVSPSRSLPPLSHRRSLHAATGLPLATSTTVTNNLPPPANTNINLSSVNSHLIGAYSPPPPMMTSNGGDQLQNKLRQLLVGSSGDSGGGIDDEDLNIEQLGPLSPPAEYAAGSTTTTTARSSSSSQQQTQLPPRCHKSLPDLHCRAVGGGCNVGMGGYGCGTSGAMVSSGATMIEPSSNKSSNKSLSNRDSGGSSGHYTQHSEPPPPPRQDKIIQEIRRDSGSSTQHSGTSSYYCCQEAECRIARHHQVAIYPTVPVAPAITMPTIASYQPTLSTVQQQSQTILNTNTNGATTVTFKRQKCLRYNKRDRPILRSKSDISDRYWRPPDGVVGGTVGVVVVAAPVSHLEQFFEHLGLTSDSYEDMLSLSRSSSISPVFFSDVSTVDSSAPLDNTNSSSDYHHHSGGGGGVGGGCTSGGATIGTGTPATTTVGSTATFRPNEPPSIVERNARIIKWLCNCRKSQML